MKGTKIFGMALAVVFFVFVIAPVVSAQGMDSGILDGVWFKMKASYKGYELDYDHNSVVGTSSGGSTAYMEMNYDDTSSPASYWVKTCVQDNNDPGKWHTAWPDHPISLDDIYGALEIWNYYGDLTINFDNGHGTGTFFYVVPQLSTKITTNGSKLKKASIKSFTCAVWGELGGDHAVLGSCSLSGSNVAPEKVPPDCTK